MRVWRCKILEGENMEYSYRPESGHPSGFILGALVGAGIALLFAPRAGSDTRRFLRDYAARTRDELAEDVDAGAQALDSAVKKGQEFVEKGKKSLHDAGRQAKAYSDAGSKAVQDVKDELTSTHR